MPEISEKDEKKKTAWKHFLDYGVFPDQADINTLNDLKKRLKEKAEKRISEDTSNEVKDFLTGKQN